MAGCRPQLQHGTAIAGGSMTARRFLHAEGRPTSAGTRSKVFENAEIGRNPKSCDRFDGCNAPYCPLDEERHRRVHLDGDRMCHYMLQAVKVGAVARFSGGPTEALLKAAVEVVANRQNLVRP